MIALGSQVLRAENVKVWLGSRLQLLAELSPPGEASSFMIRYRITHFLFGSSREGLSSWKTVEWGCHITPPSQMRSVPRRPVLLTKHTLIREQRTGEVVETIVKHLFYFFELDLVTWCGLGVELGENSLPVINPPCVWISTRPVALGC